MALTSFQGHSLISGISFEPVNGFSLNLHRYIIEARLRADLLLVTLTSFQGHSLVNKISFEPVDGFSSNLH